MPERPDPVWVALLWSATVGSLIGGCGATVLLAFEGAAPAILEAPWVGLLFPLAIAGASLFVVIPCTLLFGVPSALLIRRFGLSPWPALALCIAIAIIIQIACVWLLFWDDYSDAADYLFTTPFALGAAVVLWWRLNRP